MKRQVAISFIVASLFIVSPKSAFAGPKSPSSALTSQKQTRTVQLLMTKIRAQLPAGWKATYEPQYQWLKVTRLKPVLMETTWPNMPDAPNAPTPQQFEITFRVVSFVSSADYKRLKADNEAIEQHLQTLYVSLSKQRISHKYDYFLPSNVAEKAQIEKYNQLKKSLRVLPDFFFGDIALSKARGFDNSQGCDFYVTDDKERDECDQIVRETIQMLTSYETTRTTK